MKAIVWLKMGKTRARHFCGIASGRAATMFYRQALGVLLLFFALAVTLASASTVLEAAVMVKLGLADLAGEADAVISGKVAAVRSQWDESGLLIYTYVSIEPQEIFKGDIGPHGVSVKVRGGIVGAVGQITPGSPSFAPGEEVIVFLKGTADPGVFTVVGLSQGKFFVERDRVTGEKYALADLSGIAFYDVSKREIDRSQKSSLSTKTLYDLFRSKLQEAVSKAEERKTSGDSVKR